MNKLLSIQEAATLLGVHPETLRRWDNEGKLQAIKIGDRGDRKYRQEDIIKIISGFAPETYKGFNINPHNLGFERLPDRLIRVASFLVFNRTITSSFAFTDGGMLLHMANPNIKDEDLLKEAKNIIKHYIDNSLIEHLEEYTFDYYPGNYIYVRNAIWWTKSLKQIYG